MKYMEKKNRILIIIVFLCIILLISLALKNKAIGKDHIYSYAEGRAEAIAAFIEEEEALENGEISEDDIEYIGEINGNKISKKFFMVRYISRVSSELNYESYKEDTWDSFKRDVLNKEYAIEHCIYPTNEEIVNAVESNKAEFEAMDESETFFESFLSGLGMTAEEYWNYNLKYEAPYGILNGNVEEYIEENKLEPLDYDSVESIIIDEEFYNSLQ